MRRKSSQHCLEGQRRKQLVIQHPAPSLQKLHGDWPWSSEAPSGSGSVCVHGRGRACQVRCSVKSAAPQNWSWAPCSPPPCPRLLPPCMLWTPSPAKPGWMLLKDPHPRATTAASRPHGSLGDIREDAAQIHVAGAFLLQLYQDLRPGPVLHCGWQLSSIMVSREARLSVTTVLLPSCLLP